MMSGSIDKLQYCSIISKSTEVKGNTLLKSDPAAILRGEDMINRESCYLLQVLYSLLLVRTRHAMQ